MRKPAFFKSLLSASSFFFALAFGLQAQPTDSLVALWQNMAAKEILIQANKLTDTKPDAAQKGFEAARAKALDEGLASLLISIDRDHGLFFEERNQLDSAVALYERALGTAESLSADAEKRSIFNDLAIVCRKLAKYRLSKRYHLAALELAEQAGDDETIEFSMHGLGYLYEMVGDYLQALDYYLQSKKAAERRGSASGQIITLQNLARTLAHLGRENESIANIERALLIAQGERDSVELANAYFAYGEISALLKRPDRALDMFEKSEALHLASQSLPDAALDKMRRAEILAHQLRFGEAAALYEACLKWRRALPPDQLADIWLALGKACSALKKPLDAETAFLKSFETAEKHALGQQTEASARALHDLYVKLGKPEKALFYLKKSASALRTIEKEKTATGNEALEFRYDQEQNERAFQQLKLRQGRLTLLAVLAVGLSLALFLFYFLRTKRSANLRLEEKNDEIEAHNVRLSESNTFLQQFTYAVAHDLKAPLRTVGSFIQVLEQRFGGQFSVEAREYMSIVTNGVKRMDSLIKDLLEYSKISAQRPGAGPTDSQTVFDEAKKALSSLLSEKNAVIEGPVGLPVVAVERSHLVVLLQNLLANGLKYNASPSPMVRLDGFSENGRARFSIDDNGIGIDPSHSKKIFELFHQLHKNKGFSGTGIGLTICKNIIDKYEGRIWFEPSQKLGGTTFWVELPAPN